MSIYIPISNFFVPCAARMCDLYNNVHIKCISYQTEYYSDEFFKSFNIPMPSHLKNAVNKRKAEYLAGRWCAQKALDKLGVKNAVIHQGSHRCPSWPEGIVGSITHSAGFAACAVTRKDSDSTYLGIDFEIIPSIETVKAVQAQAFSLIERSRLQSLIKGSNIDESLVTLLIFSAKESFFKAMYPKVQAYFGFHALEFMDWNWETQCLHFFVQRRLIPGAWDQDFISIRFSIFPQGIFTILFENGERVGL